MKKKIYFLPPAIIIAVILLTAFGGGTNNSDYPSGAPAGYTGSPGDGQNCTACHGGSSSTQAGIISSNIPVSGYSPGLSYTITVSLTGSGNKGFEVSPQDAGGALLGTLTAGPGSKLVGSGKYCTHTTDVGGSSATWNFTWTAPAAGTGSVSFFGAFTISKSVTKLSTLVVNESNVGIPCRTTDISSFSLSPNPSTGIISIYWINKNENSLMLRVIDLNGKILRTESITEKGSPLIHRMDLSSLQKGVYFVKVETKEGVRTEKLILE